MHVMHAAGHLRLHHTGSKLHNSFFCPAFLVASLSVHRQLELRRQLDVDGWAADVTALRKTLAAVDRKLLQMRLIERWGGGGASL